MSLIEKPSIKAELDAEMAKIANKPIKKTVKGNFGRTGTGKKRPSRMKIKPDPESITLLHVGVPKPVQRKNCNRKYEIPIQYSISKGKPIRKTILFGDVRQTDYIDNGDAKTRSLVISHLRNYDNPLEPNFYRLKLLNSHNNLNDSYHALLKEVIKL